MSKKNKNSVVNVYRVDLNIEIDRGIDKKIKDFVRDVFEKEFKRTDYEIAVVFTSNNYIRRLNKRYLEHDWATDVLCFPYSKGKRLVSDIIISVEKAKSQAKFYNSVVEKEIFFLVAHGILHLLGWNDSGELQRKKMWAKQKELLNRFLPNFGFKIKKD